MRITNQIMHKFAASMQKNFLQHQNIHEILCAIWMIIFFSFEPKGLFQLTDFQQEMHAKLKKKKKENVLQKF